MTDNTQELDEILNKYAEHYFDQLEGFGSVHTLNKTEAKQAILDWHNKQVIKTLERLYPDCNADISVAADGGVASDGTIDDLINKLKEAK